MQATLLGLKSREWTRAAPSRWAARENSPLPLPTSTKVQPASDLVPSMSRRERQASSTRSSSRTLRKRAQFAPNSKRWPAWTSSA